MLDAARQLRLGEVLGNMDWGSEHSSEIEKLLEETWDSDGGVFYAPGGFFASAGNQKHSYVSAGLAALALIQRREGDAPGVLDRTGISISKMHRYFRDQAVGTRSLLESPMHFEGALAYWWLRHAFDLPVTPRRERLAFLFMNLSVLVSIALAMKVLLGAPKSVAEGPSAGN